TTSAISSDKDLPSVKNSVLPIKGTVSNNGDCGPSYKAGLFPSLPEIMPLDSEDSEALISSSVNDLAIIGREVADSIEVAVIPFKKSLREFFM
ncbi:MAG: hypothetical protein GY797_29810, partial [Deltaproteobacteria bacterium]|nr:hypothetical protein [Deltaproteobacteria bacterium]